MQKNRTYSRYTIHASQLLGKQITLLRKDRGWNQLELAKRAGIARNTLQKIEQGDLKCEIGLVFEVAALVGLKLFEADEQQLSNQLNTLNDKLALLPHSVRTSMKEVDDDF